MGPLVVVELDPIADHAAGVLQGFEAVAVDALLFQRADRKRPAKSSPQSLVIP